MVQGRVGNPNRIHLKDCGFLTRAVFWRQSCQANPFYDDSMKWEKDGSSIEMRTQDELPDGRPALDEIVASGASVHLEQMAHDHWWMGLEAGGKYFHLNFGVQDGRLWVRLSDQATRTQSGKAIIGRGRCRRANS